MGRAQATSVALIALLIPLLMSGGIAAPSRARANPDETATLPAVPACTLLDEGEGEGEGEPEGEPTVSGGGARGGLLRHALPLGAALAVLAAARGSSGGRARLGTFLLAGCAALAVGHYTDFGRWRNGRYVNGWEFFHYYLGSKYLAELGYTRLYAAALIADEESGRAFRHEKDALRDLTDGGCVRVDEVLAQRDRIVARFSPRRWEEFVQDVVHFKTVLSPWQWNRVFHDKGYNATPVWSLAAGPLTNRISTSSPRGLLGLALLDPLLLACALAAIWRSFGARCALLAVILIGTHMTTSHSHLKGAFLRTDWVVSLVLAACALKSGRPALGGVLVAAAAASRVFPALFGLGLFAGPLVALVRGRPPSPAQVRFVLGFVAAAALLVLAALVVIGPAHWQEFARKIWQHNDSFSPWRVGFKHVFLGAYDYLPEGAGTHQAAFHERRGAWWGIQVVVVAAFVRVTRRLEDWEVLACGFVPTFFLVAPTYYYYVMLVLPLLFFAGRIRRAEGAAGLIGLFASSSVAYALHDRVGRELPLFYALSCMILGLCGLMAFSALLQARRAARRRCFRRDGGRWHAGDPRGGARRRIGPRGAPRAAGRRPGGSGSRPGTGGTSSEAPASRPATR